MRIERERYLQRLISSRNNGQIKLLTGIRRCGKSYLLNALYRDYLAQDDILPWTDEKGVQYINVEDFLPQRINEL